MLHIEQDYRYTVASRCRLRVWHGEREIPCACWRNVLSRVIWSHCIWLDMQNLALIFIKQYFVFKLQHLKTSLQPLWVHKAPFRIELIIRDRPIYRITDICPEFFFLLVTYTIIQSITSSEMCSLYLTHPSAHTQQWALFTQRLMPRKCSSKATACNFEQYSLVWNTLNYINIYYRTIILPINISIEINYLLSPQAIAVWV